MMRFVSLGWFLVLLVVMAASAPTLEYFLYSPDMGYQLSLGYLVRSGRFPFVDMLQHYGPLVSFTSAAGQWVHRSVVPEVAICCLGYSLALFCIYCAVMRGSAARKGWATLAGLAASLVAWCVLARFYKWYYWCFPVLTLVCCSNFTATGIRWRFIAGCVAGVGFLYRHDLGAACLLAVAVIHAAQFCLMPGWRRAMDMGWVAAGFVFPLIGWFILLGAVGGGAACGWYLSSLWTGTSGMAAHWGLPLPRWDWRHPASDSSCRFHLLVMFAVTYAVAMGAGARALLRDRQAASAESFLLLGAGVLGLAISPQALFRPDLQHILQIIPPLLIVAPLLVLRLMDPRPAGDSASWRQAVRTATALAYLALLIFPLVCLRADFRCDLAPLGRDLPGRYRALAAGLDAADPANPVVRAVRTMQRNTLPDQPILVMPLLPQLYFWTDRPMSGLLNGYAGIFSSDPWRRRVLAAVLQNPPALVLNLCRLDRESPEALLRKYDPELYGWLTARYSRIVDETPEYVLYAPQQGDAVQAPSGIDAAPQFIPARDGVPTVTPP